MDSPRTNIADRLGSTLFVAALAHGLVILGVTFTAAPLESSEETPSLNVTLLVDTGEIQPEPRESDLLADRNRRGGGELQVEPRPAAMLSADRPRAQLGDPLGADLTDGTPREPAPEADRLLTRGPAERELSAKPSASEDAAAKPMKAAMLLERAQPRSLAAELDARAAASAGGDPDAAPSPSARESAVAAYLVDWRRRVERIGTANFPQRFLEDDVHGRPTLEVAIGRGGQLEEIVVRKSSGDGRLDRAALDILRLAAPFEPLPAAIAAEHGVLRFAYEWDFSVGEAGAR